MLRLVESAMCEICWESTETTCHAPTVTNFREVILVRSIDKFLFHFFLVNFHVNHLVFYHGGRTA